MSHPEPLYSTRTRLDTIPTGPSVRPSELTSRHTEPAAVTLPSSMSLDDRLIQIESGLIGWALGLTRGNKTKAAEILKIKRSTLGDRINRCRLNGYDL